MWSVNPLEDYLKFKGITPIGLLLYPIIAPCILLLIGWLMLSFYSRKFIKSLKK